MFNKYSKTLAWSPSSTPVFATREEQVEWDSMFYRASEQRKEEVQVKLAATANRVFQPPAPGTAVVGQAGPSNAVTVGNVNLSNAPTPSIAVSGLAGPSNAVAVNNINLMLPTVTPGPSSNGPVIIDAYDPLAPLPRHMMQLYASKPDRHNPINGVGMPNQVTKGVQTDLQFFARLVPYHLLGARNNAIALKWTDAPVHKTGAPKPLHNKSSIICNRLKKARKDLRLGLTVGEGTLRETVNDKEQLKAWVRELFGVLDSRAGQLEEAVYHNCTWPIDHRTKTFSAPPEVKAIMAREGIVGGDVRYPVEVPKNPDGAVRELLAVAELEIQALEEYLVDHPEYVGYEPARHNTYWVEARDKLMEV